MKYENIKIESPAEHVKILTFNREPKLNALSVGLISEVIAAFDEFRTDGTKAVILTGAGEKSFVAGADIGEMAAKDMSGIEAFAVSGQKMVRSLEEFPGIVIAAVNGYAFGGGCEILLGCDWAVAVKNAKIGQPEVKLGITAGFGGSQRLPRIVGRFHAMRILADGQPVSAEEALNIGLVTRIYDSKEDMIDACVKHAETVLQNSFNAVRKTKEAVLRGLDMDLQNGCAVERDIFGLCCAHPDGNEGMTAFLEKRKANFTSSFQFSC